MAKKKKKKIDEFEQLQDDKEINEGIFYDEDNDMHLFKYQIHYLNTDNKSLLN